MGKVENKKLHTLIATKKKRKKRKEETPEQSYKCKH